MPKIIENLENRLIEEARRQIEESGYGAMTIRSVAKGCGVGTGTVYNYYDSKDAMVAAFMLVDWKECIRRIEVCSDASAEPASVLRCIHEQLLVFSHMYETVFLDQTAAAAFAGSFSQYHGLLRSQLSAPIRRFCQDDFTADFIAEAMLVWTIQGKRFDQIHELVSKLF